MSISKILLKLLRQTMKNSLSPKALKEQEPCIVRVWKMKAKVKGYEFCIVSFSFVAFRESLNIDSFSSKSVFPSVKESAKVALVLHNTSRS